MPLFENVGNTKMTIKTEEIMPLQNVKNYIRRVIPIFENVKKKKMILSSNKAMPDFENVRNIKLTIITYGVMALKC